MLGEMNDRSLAGNDCDLHHIIWMIVMRTRGVTLIVVFVRKLKDQLFVSWFPRKCCHSTDYRLVILERVLNVFSLFVSTSFVQSVYRHAWRSF